MKKPSWFSLSGFFCIFRYGKRREAKVDYFIISFSAWLNCNFTLQSY